MFYYQKYHQNVHLQYVYSIVYPRINCATETRGFYLKSTFHIVFKIYKDKKMIEQLRENPQNYENNHAETCVFEQKPINIDERKLWSALKKEKQKGKK